MQRQPTADACDPDITYIGRYSQISRPGNGEVKMDAWQPEDPPSAHPVYPDSDRVLFCILLIVELDVGRSFLEPPAPSRRVSQHLAIAAHPDVNRPDVVLDDYLGMLTHLEAARLRLDMRESEVASHKDQQAHGRNEQENGQQQQSNSGEDEKANASKCQEDAHHHQRERKPKPVPVVLLEPLTRDRCVRRLFISHAHNQYSFLESHV